MKKNKIKKDIKKMEKEEYDYYYLITEKNNNLNCIKVTILNNTKTKTSINTINGWREPKQSAKGFPVKLENLYHPESIETINLINIWKNQLKENKKIEKIKRDLDKEQMKFIETNEFKKILESLTTPNIEILAKEFISNNENLLKILPNPVYKWIPWFDEFNIRDYSGLVKQVETLSEIKDILDDNDEDNYIHDSLLERLYYGHWTATYVSCYGKRYISASDELDSVCMQLLFDWFKKNNKNFPYDNYYAVDVLMEFIADSTSNNIQLAIEINNLITKELLLELYKNHTEYGKL